MASDQQCAPQAAGGAVPEEEEEERAELTTFACKVVYIYLPLPPAPSYGHRAELWDVDKWFREVGLKVVSVGDLLFIRLLDLDSGELFAECPLPSDGSPLTRAVEPVVDSSRYYVLKVVDREDHKKHAFVGLGFRERSESSSFSSALDEYRQYLRRKAEAAQLRAAFEPAATPSTTPQGQGQGQGAGEEGGAAPDGAGEGGSGAGGVERAGAGGRYALPVGQTISIRLPTAGQGSGGGAASTSAAGTAVTPSSMRTSGSTGNPSLASSSPAPPSASSPSHLQHQAHQQGATSSSSGGPRGASNDGSAHGRQLMRVFSLTEGVAGVRLLPPPPPGAPGGQGQGGAGGIVLGPGDRALSGRTSGHADWAVFSDTMPTPAGLTAQLLQGTGSGGGSLGHRTGSTGTPNSSSNSVGQQQHLLAGAKSGSVGAGPASGGLPAAAAAVGGAVAGSSPRAGGGGGGGEGAGGGGKEKERRAGAAGASGGEGADADWGEFQ